MEKKKKFSHINGVAQDHAIQVQKGETLYTLALQPWKGFAIGADEDTLKGKGTSNGFIPVGINRIYGGNYSIFLG